jgi:hypothetical protein
MQEKNDTLWLCVMVDGQTILGEYDPGQLTEEERRNLPHKLPTTFLLRGAYRIDLQRIVQGDRMLELMTTQHFTGTTTGVEVIVTPRAVWEPSKKWVTERLTPMKAMESGIALPTAAIPTSARRT